MRDIGGADADDVGAQFVHHASEVVVCVGDVVAVGGLLGLGQGVIEHADHLDGRGQLQPSGDVPDVGDHACADDGYFVWGHVFLLSELGVCSFLRLHFAIKVVYCR